MKYSLFFLIGILFSSFKPLPARQNTTNLADSNYVSPLSEFSDEWNDPKYEVCNTAANANYMTAKEKEVIYILNLARMNPQLFCSTVVEIDADEKETDNHASLVVTMKAMSPLNLLAPNKSSFESALCHAITSGKKGYVGHDRQTQSCKKAEHYFGECCSYGESDALGIVMQLLVDDGVPSLGHRKICFDNIYTSIGVSIQPHKKYGKNAVLDFYY
jgi:uncharacterized protein YkwD